MKTQKRDLLLTLIIIGCLITISTPIAYNIITYEYPPNPPTQPYAILDKKTTQSWHFILFPITCYWFQYTNHTNAWLEATQTDYENYQTGDTFPNNYTIIH